MAIKTLEQTRWIPVSESAETEQMKKDEIKEESEE
jgi:hypothetical protein